MYNNFNSRENKRLLWQLLYENNIFNNIENNKIDDIKKIFEQQIDIINNNNKILTLTDKNKELIKQMIDNTKFFKKIKNVKPLEEIEIEISKDFQNKKEEMFNLLKKPKQEDIDFNEAIDNPITSKEMDDILSEMIQNRNIDVKSIESNKNKKVNFDIENKNDLFFLDKLKKQDNNNEENINSKLDKILNNQQEILSYLKFN